MKNSAATEPTKRRAGFGASTRAEPSVISATPDASTVVSSSSGTNSGTCAVNSLRAKVR
ncbi:hypothetical protein K0028_04265 [Curtobacterium flaccumfaciens pv. flaccumfaciens]|nr:hypothetical protein K0028_04265 [Curtobacterium flaccumfaciens pv. flaccumfaciens]